MKVSRYTTVNENLDPTERTQTCSTEEYMLYKFFRDALGGFSPGQLYKVLTHHVQT